MAMNHFASSVLAVALATSLASAAEDASLVFQKAHAVLEKNCFKCHSHVANKIKGGLLLDSREAALAGGDTDVRYWPSKGNPQWHIRIYPVVAVRHDATPSQ